MPDNRQKIYNKLVNSGYKGTYEQFDEYLNGGDENISKVFKKLQSDGYKGTLEQFTEYAGIAPKRITVQDVESQNKDNAITFDKNTTSFDDWYQTVPADRNDTTNYNLRRAYELAPAEELEAWRTATPEELENGQKHLRSVYFNENGEGEFMKSKYHPTIQMELNEYEQNEDFRKRYGIDTNGTYYKYVSRGLDLDDMSMDNAAKNVQLLESVEKEISSMNLSRASDIIYGGEFNEVKYNDLLYQQAILSDYVSRLKGSEEYKRGVQEIHSFNDQFREENNLVRGDAMSKLRKHNWNLFGASGNVFMIEKMMHMSNIDMNMLAPGQEDMYNDAAADFAIYGAEQKVRLAEDELANGTGGFGTQFARGWRNSNWNKLDKQMTLNMALQAYKIAKKFDENGELLEGQTLSESETRLFKALQIAYLADNTVVETMWERIGENAPEQVKYTLEFILTSELMGASALSKGIAGAATRKIEGQVAKKLVYKAIDYTAQPLLQTLYNPLNWMEGSIERQTGNLTYDENTGNFAFAGAQNEWDATRNAIVSAWIENFSEKIGEDIFKPAKYGNKYLRNMDNAFGRTYNQFATKIDIAIENAGLNKLDDVLKISKDIRLATGVQGIPGEYVEEVVGGIMDAMFVGDQSFHQYDENGNPNPNYLWNSEQQLETFLSCAVMSVGMTTVSNVRNGAVTAADRRKAKSYLNQMAKAMENQDIDTESIDKAFENGTINDVSDIVFKMGSAEDMTDDKRQILANYVAAKINYAAMRNADMSAIEDSFSEIEKEAYASVSAETKDAGGAGGRIIQANVEVNGETFEGVPIVSGRVLTRIETDANGNDYMVLDTRGSSSVLYIRVPGEEKARPIYSSNVTGIVAATPVEQYIETQKNELTGMMTEMFGAQYDGGLPLEQLIAECAVLSDKEVQTGTMAVQQLEKGRKYNIVNPSTGELTEAEYVEDTENKSHVFSINGDNVELNDGELKESMLRYRLALAEESGAIDEAAQIELDALLREREADQATAPMTDDQFVETAVSNQVSKDDSGNYTPDSNPRAVAVDILMKSGYDVEKARLAIANTVNGLVAQVGAEEVSAPSIDENIVNNTKNNAEYNNALIEMYSQALTEMDLYVQNYVGEPEIGETYTLTNETGTVYGRFEGYDANGNVQYRETDESGENDGRLVVLPKNEFQKQRRAHNIEIQAQKPITIENAQEIAEETPVIPTETIAENAEENAVVPPVEETPVKEEIKLPRDKDNNIDYKQITDPALYAKGLTEEFGDDAQSVIDELIADEKKNLEKAGTKNAIERRRAQKAAQSSIDFYNQVKNTLAPKPSDDVKVKNVAPKDSKAFEKRIAQAINEIGEPTSFEDEVLRRLANSSHQFKWGSDGTHKGMGAMLGFKGGGSEMISRASFLSKNGKYFDEVALDIWQDLPEAYNENHTDQEVRDLMIDFLRSYSNPFEMVDAIRQMQLGARNGETIDEAADRQQEESLESIAASYGMTVDEFNEAVYKANELNMSLDEYLAINYAKEEFVKEISLADEQYENYTNFAAEQILAEEQGEQYDTGRTESDTELHQGEAETAQQGGIRPVVGESTGTGRKRGNIGEEREVQQERNQHGSDELPDKGVAAEPYQPRSQRGKDRAVELDNAISAQRERVASARSEYDKAVSDFNKRNGLFGDTADNDDSLFGDLADFSKENFERISAEKQTKIENEQKRLDEIVAQRDNELREIDEAEDKQSALEFAEQEVDTNPTDAQKEAGNYKKGHVTIDGFDISIENPRGSVRSGVDENDNEWSVTMHDTYGYIRNTESVDGDHIDIFLSDHIGNWNGSVFVVDQVKPDGSFDEHKVMYGFDTEEEAREAYLANYSEGWQGLGNITEVSKRGFKKWIESSHRKTKPFREYRDIILNNKTVDENPSGNKLVTDAQYEELKRRMRDKLRGQVNVGIDPEILSIGVQMAVYHIEKGTRKFADYAKAMIADLGDVIRPYLKAFYNGARELPEVEEAGYDKEMTPYDEVKKFDVANFDKETEDLGETISVVEQENRIEEQTEKIKETENNGKKSLKQKKSLLSLQQSLFDEQDNNKLNQDNNGQQRTDELRTEGLPAKSVRHEQGSTAEPEAAGERAEEEAARPDTDRGREGSESDRSLQSGLRELKNQNNNHAERGTDYAPKSVDARIEANIKAIELMQQLIDTGEQATPEQMAVLRQFSGWGGLGKAFSESSYSWSPNSANARLKELLGVEAYEQANMSRNSAYYTPASVIDTLWDIAKALGFKGGNILEGSAGIGNILGLMPSQISGNSNIHAVEIDQTAGNILSLLYPDANVEVQGFEATKIENGSIDLAITNVPFVTGLRVNDTTGDKDLSKKFHDIHDFCIAKNIRKLRDGGIGIFITSNGTLDNSARLREWIVSEGNADVVGAFRLNNNTFGGTGATSDIVVVRKRINGKKSVNAINVNDISGERVAEFNTGKTKTVNRQQVPIIKPLSMDYNAYFINHPEMMGGKMYFGFEKGETYRETSKALYPENGINQNERLASFVKDIESKDWSQEALTFGDFKQAINARFGEELGENVKEGSMLVDKKGVLCIAQRGRAVPLDVNANKVKGHTKVECFKSYQGIKQALADVLDYQTQNDSDEGLQPLLDKLNRMFDNFVKTYGHLHKNTSITFLKNDVDFSNIVALETYKETGDINGNKIQTYGKTDVFTRRVVEKDKAPEPKNIKDGIIASIYLHGRVDIPYISKQLNMSEDDVKSDILNSGLGFENPSSKEIEVSYEYLSGNVREKLEQAIANNTDGRYNKNIEELEKIIPMTIPSHLIDFSLGSSWINPTLYEEYVKDRTDISVEFTAAGGSWYMKAPYFVNEEKNRTSGVLSKMLNKLIYGTQLIEAAMQNRTITVSETRKKWDGSTETTVDKEATQACANKIDEIRQDFKDWAKAKMQSDSEMSQRIERIYNDMFNNYVPKEIPDDFIPEYFGGATHNIKLRTHQAKAVIRGTTQPLLLAHEVGTGKTFTLISIAMEMRRLGTAQKPMIVVQNSTVGQFVESAKQLYPNAKVLTIEDKDHTGEGRKNFYAKIKYNDWDMIVVPQSVFERIPDSEERQMAFIQDKIEEKMLVLQQMQDADQDGNSMIVRQAEREIDQLEEQKAGIAASIQEKRKKRDEKKDAITIQNTAVKALEMLDRAVDDVDNFDDMGIDAVLVDEAHEYKHLGFATAMQRGVKGVDPSYSKKAQGVFLKTQAVLEKNNGRNVIFATGTPISNTAAEIWTFMRYLMPADTMKSYGIYYFDDFVRNFGNLQQMLEFTTSGKFRENNRFAGYVNIPELVRIWSSVADTVLTKDAGGVNDKIPETEGGKAQDIYLPQTKSLRSVMKYVKAKLDEYEKMTGKEKKANSHIPLVMYGIAKAAAVDARLVIEDAVDEPNSKTNEAVRQVLRSLDETKEYKGTVALFADNYQNKQSGFNLYEDIKAKLIDAGVPENQIVIMKSGMSIKKKLEIFDKVNNGEVRVIMGSTFTLGTGVNIQERLHTLIHIDAPNRPMDYTQRNGRILRQGNLHKQMGKPVRVLRFGVEDSLDVTAYQRLKTKGAIADSIMNGKNMMINNMENRVLEEEEDVFGDTVAQLSGSEYAMLKNQAEKDVRKYEAKYKQWQSDQIYVRNELPNVKTRIEYNKKAIADAKKALDTVKKAYNGNLDITIGKLKFNSIDGMKDFITEYNKSIMAAENEVKNANGGEQTRSLTININGIDFVVNTTVKYEMLQKGTTLSYVARRNMRYSCAQLGLEDIPVKQSLVRNAIDDIVYNIMTGKEFESDIQSDQTHLDRYEKSYEQLKQRDGKEFEFTAELEASRKRLEEYTAKMKEEMEEKEKKYAAIDAEVEAAENIIEAEEAEENESEETERLSVEENNETTDETNESQEIAFNAVKDSLAKAGIEVVEATERDIQDLMSRNRGIKDSNGKLMGWVGADGKIYLTKEGMNANTAIHEYTHLWAEALQMNNPELWNKIKDLLRDTPIWNEVVSSSAYENIKDNDDEIAGEALSRISGKANAKRMEDTARRIMDANPGVEGAAQAATLLGKLRDALNKFWTWVGKKLFGINKISVADMILADLVNGVNPINPNGGKEKTAGEQTKVTESLQPIEAAKIQRISDNLSEIAKKIISSDNAKGFITALSTALEAEVKGASRYANFTLSDGTTLSIRISNHNANANNYIEKGTVRDSNISIVVKQRRRGNSFVSNEDVPLMEFSYLKNNLTGEDMSNIATSLADALQNGVYEDRTGKAKVNISGTQSKDRLSVEAQTEFETHEMNTAIVSDILNNKLGIDSSDMRRKTIKRRLVDAKRKWMDSLDPLKKLQQSIAEATGKPLADFEDAYNAELRRASISMPMIERYTDDYLLPMIESVGDILKEGVDEKTLGLYLIAKHGLERNEYFKKLNDWKEVQDMSGLTALAAELDRGDEDFTQVAKDFVNEIENTVPKNMLDNMWSRINNTTNAILAKYLESGLISKKQYDDYRKRYNNYVPLRGWDETTSDEFYNYSVLDPHFQSAIKQAKGRTSLANNVLANIMNMTESAIVIGEKNKVLQRLFNLAQGRKSDVLKTQRSWYVKNQQGEWEETLPIITEDMTPGQVKSIIEQFEQNMERMSALGEAKQSLNRADVGVKIKPFNVHEHYVPVFVNGRKHAIIINADPTIVKSLTDSNELANTKFVSALRNTTRFMSQLNTTFNPEFIVKNVLRDAGMAMISSYIEGGMKYANKVRSNINKFGYRYLGQLIRNGECDNTEITQYWKEFIENGGETGFTRTLNVDEQAKRLKKLYKKMLSGKDIDQKGMFETVTSAIDSFNRWGEDLSRFAVFVTNRQLGKTVEQSVNMAKNATINFQRKGGGTLAAWFRTTRSFFNAGMQALYRFGSLAKNNPKRFAIASTAMVISGLLVPALNIMMLSLMGGDDDDWNAYRFMSEFTGNHSWHMFVGDGFITIPYPQEFAALFAAGNIVFRHAIGWADNNSTIAGDIANMALEQLPFDMGGGGSIDWKIMNAVTPQVLQPFVEVYINEDFMGRPIYKKNPFNENDPAWTKAYKSTSGTLVELAKRLNGNDPVMKHSKYFDWLDNPAAWQHIITGEAGGIGRIVSNVSRLVENGYTADNMPFLRNIYMTSDMSKYAPQVSRDYYNILNGFNEMKNNINGYENDGESLYDNLERYMKLKTSPEYKAYLATKDLTKTIKEKQDSLKLMQAYDFSDEDILQMRLTITSLQIMVLDITNNMIIDEGRPMTKEFRQVIDNIKKGEEE